MTDSATIPDEPERWLPVVGWVGLYEVSDLGRVRSLSRWSAQGIRRGRVLKGAVQAGYRGIVLSGNGLRVNAKVHVLVLEAFVGPRPPGQVSRHGPGGALDNRLANLCYGTQVENIRDKLRDGTDNNGERHGQAKLTSAIVTEARRRHWAGESQAALAREYGVNQVTLGNAVRGKTWRTVDAPVTPIGERRGETHGMAKLTQVDVDVIRRRYAAGETQEAIARDFSVGRLHVGRIVRGERWADSYSIDPEPTKV